MRDQFLGIPAKIQLCWGINFDQICLLNNPGGLNLLAYLFRGIKIASVSDPTGSLTPRINFTVTQAPDATSDGSVTSGSSESHTLSQTYYPRRTVRCLGRQRGEGLINSTLYTMCFTAMSSSTKWCELCLATSHTERECAHRGDPDPGMRERLKSIEAAVVAMTAKPTGAPRHPGYPPPKPSGEPYLVVQVNQYMDDLLGLDACRPISPSSLPEKHEGGKDAGADTGKKNWGGAG